MIGRGGSMNILVEYNRARTKVKYDSAYSIPLSLLIRIGYGPWKYWVIKRCLLEFSVRVELSIA